MSAPQVSSWQWAWAYPDEWQPPVHDPEPGLRIEELEDGDIMIIAGHDGTPTGAETRDRALEAYLCERLESRGIAGVGSAFTTETAVIWTLELYPGR